MTTTDAVAAWQMRNSRKRAPLVLAICATLSAASLAGCGSSNLLGSNDQPTSVMSSPAVLPVHQPTSSQSKVAVAPIMGAPDAVSKDVAGLLGSSLERQRVSVSKDGERPDYTLRGYMVATRERASTKVAYIFDLTDPAGKRVNRIQGEEMAQGGDAKNPWSAITPEVAQRITDKTATSLSTALASLGATATTTSSSAAPPVGVGAPANPSAAQDIPAAVATNQTTGSIDRGATAGAAAISAALVPNVVGAPGDGNASLSAAMRQELQQAGIGNASAGQRAYSVAGKVSVSAAKDGKQSVKIDWRVSDPSGGLLATVSQNNDIQAGALDGSWGGIAQEAAQGAASKIKTLIDEHKASGGTASGSPRTAGASRPRT